jgi:hypothetical protein
MNINKPITDNTTVIEQAKAKVLPQFIKVDSEILASNTATIAAWVNDVSYVYYILALDGSLTPTETELLR